MAEAYSKIDNKEQARATLESLISKFPNSPFKTQAPNFVLVILSASNLDFEKALVHYNAVIQADDEQDLKEYARYGKAWVLIQQSNFAEALDLALDVAKQTTDASLRVESSLAASVCLRKIGKPEEVYG